MTTPTNVQEIWKPVTIEGYENFYHVSNLGRVKSLAKTIIVPQGTRKEKERILKPFTNDLGYKKVTLAVNKKKKLMSIHRLVALAFIPNPENKPQVNHINENPSDNRLSNLNWMTAKENTNHGTAIERKAAKKRVKVYQYTKTGDFVKEWNSFAETSLAGFNHGNIIAVCQGKRKSHKGFLWSYTKKVDITQRQRVSVFIKKISDVKVEYSFRELDKMVKSEIIFESKVPYSKAIKKAIRDKHSLKQVLLIFGNTNVSIEEAMLTECGTYSNKT